uniref:Uncharacterized protein n=1 Tax=Nelumbo nucifera TaxID=4432 RepID=A0A822XLN6_NELNU|nr:TPA_asm: hypothetical protein HUJ06_022650 [Nelumbo nucifera]
MHGGCTCEAPPCEEHIPFRRRKGKQIRRVRVLCTRWCIERVNPRMEKGHVDQANVNARLSVNVVWSVHADANRFVRHELVWNSDKRASFLRFCFPTPNPSSIGGGRASAVYRR